MSKKSKTIVSLVVLILLSIISISGVLSFDNRYAYETINQYGETIKMWGAGIYAHDYYFKASIFIGTDFTILVCIIPLCIRIFWKVYKERNIENYIQCFTIMSFILYYAASISFGITYNQLHLLYIVLLGTSFYFTAILFLKLYSFHISNQRICKYKITKGMKVFLVVSGISLFVAWLPDIISTFINNSTLELIEVYTTEITYVLDMGIISPLMFITYYQMKQSKFIGYVLFRMILGVFIGVGIMLPLQTVFQLLSGIAIPIPALITKMLLFVIMALFAGVFAYRLKHGTIYAIKKG